MPTVTELLDAAIAANDADTFHPDWCQCDPDVGVVNCEYCDTRAGLLAARRGLKQMRDAIEHVSTFLRDVDVDTLIDILDNAIKT